MNLRALHAKIAELASDTKGIDVVTNVNDDDCAVLRTENELLVATTDFINSSPAIVELGEGSWYSLGQLVVCHNLADLAGSGCSPRYFLVGVCGSADTQENELLEFTRGVCNICEMYGCSLVGGDTKVGTVRSIFGTALGVPMSSRGPFLRINGRHGHKIVVSGPLGGFAAAVACLGVGKDVFSAAELERARAMLFRTTIPFELARLIAMSEDKCAGSDLSDGLGTDVFDICQSSSLAAIISEDLIPVDRFTSDIATKLGVPAWSFSFASGGDFACVFGVPADTAEACRAAGATVIGHFEDGEPSVRSAQTGRQLTTHGHDAMRQVTFSQEILDNVRRIRDFDANSA